MRKLINRVRRFLPELRKGADLNQSVIAMLLTLLGIGAVSYYNQYVDDQRGVNCSTQLAAIQLAANSCLGQYDVVSADDIATYVTTDNLAPYLPNNGIVNTSYNCPAGGTYTLPTSFNSGTTTLSDTTCNLGTRSGTKFHALEQIP